MTTILSILTAYLAFNLFVFTVYCWDKESARNGERRIRESTLLLLAAVDGSLGAVAAQQILRHKTRKEPFRSLLLSSVILQAGFIASAAIMPDWPGGAARILAQNVGP